MNNLGFTYLEMLVVLMIVSSLTIFSTVNLSNSNDVLLLNSTVDEFVKTYDLLKIKAITLNEEQVMTFTNGCYYTENIVTECPKNLDINNNFSNKIVITQNGNIQRAGTVDFSLGSYNKSVVFSIGTGGYRIE